MVTSKDFTEGMNNLFKEFNKLNPFKKLWYKITSKKSEFQKYDSNHDFQCRYTTVEGI